MCFLAGALQFPVGHDATLQASIVEVHTAFADIAAEFGFVLSGKNKPHNFIVHMVPSVRRIGVPAEFNGGPGIEAIHPSGKRVHAGSNKKGEMQDAVGEARSQLHFVVNELEPAIARVGLAAAVASDSAGAAAVHIGTCAYATGRLWGSMDLMDSPVPLLGLDALISSSFSRFCATFHSGKPPGSPLHSAQAFYGRRCYVRRAVKLPRDGICKRSLPVLPEVMSPYAVLRPCVQLLHDVGGVGIV